VLLNNPHPPADLQRDGQTVLWHGIDTPYSLWQPHTQGSTGATVMPAAMVSMCETSLWDDNITPPNCKDVTMIYDYYVLL